MKRTIVLFLAAMALFTVPALATNLLTAGTFENAGAKDVTNWYKDSNPLGADQLYASTAHDSSWGLYKGANWGLTQTTSTIIEANTIYTFGGWGKLNDGTNPAIEFNIGYYDGSTYMVLAWQRVLLSTTWTEGSTTYTTGESGPEIGQNLVIRIPDWSGWNQNPPRGCSANNGVDDLYLTSTPLPPEVASVYGYVYGGPGSSNPLNGATVQVVGVPGTTRSTDPTGYYQIDNLTPGAVDISASATGYDTTTTGKTLAVGSNTQDFNLVATPKLSGVVYRGAGAIEPLPYATVQVGGVGGTTLHADGQGAYLLYNPPTGDVEISAAFAGYETATVTRNIASGATVTQDFNLVAIPVASGENLLIAGTFEDSGAKDVTGWFKIGDPLEENTLYESTAHDSFWGLYKGANWGLTQTTSTTIEANTVYTFGGWTKQNNGTDPAVEYDLGYFEGTTFVVLNWNRFAVNENWTQDSISYVTGETGPEIGRNLVVRIPDWAGWNETPPRGCSADIGIDDLYATWQTVPSVNTSLSGHVYGGADAFTPLENASVRIVDVLGKFAYSDVDGLYAINYLVPADYSVTISAAGYATITSDISVAEGTNVLDFHLTPPTKVGDLRAMGDGQDVSLLAAPVSYAPMMGGTAAGNYFYIEQDDRAAGIRVLNDTLGSPTPAAGSVVEITGSIQTDPSTGERFVDAGTLAEGGSSSIAPVGTNTRAINEDEKLSGILIRTSGVIRDIDPLNGTNYQWFTISDGYTKAGREVTTKVVLGFEFGDPSLLNSIAIGDFVKLTGVVSQESPTTKLILLGSITFSGPQLPAPIDGKSWSCGFEPGEGFTSGALDAQGGWSVVAAGTHNGGAATVVASLSPVMGTQSLELSAIHTDTNESGLADSIQVAKPTTEDNLKWMVLKFSIWRTPGNQDLPETPGYPTVGYTLPAGNFPCIQSNYPWWFSKDDPYGIGGHQWDWDMNTTPLGYSTVPTIAGRFVPVTLYLDFDNGVQSSWYNDTLVDNGVAFTPSVRKFSDVEFLNYATFPFTSGEFGRPVYIDNVSASWDTNP